MSHATQDAMTADHRSISEALDLRYEQLRAKLLAIAPEEMSEMLEVIRMRQEAAARKQPSSTEFAGYRTPIDAVAAYLERRGTWVERNTLVEDILEGGFAPNDIRRRKTLMDTIWYHIKKGRITRHGDDMIGLSRWNEPPSAND